MNNVVPFTCPEVPCNIPQWGPFPPPWFGPQQPPWYPGANAGVTFSLTAPINVIRGHFWWDGNVLHMFDGVAWVVIGGSGAIDGGGGGGSSGAGTVIINASQPSNPATGAQWWNGTQLQVWDGTKWNVIGPGSAAGVGTTTKVFSLSAGTSVSGVGPSSAVAAIVGFTTLPSVDTQTAYDATTKKITPKVAGNYMVFTKSYFGGGQVDALHSMLRNDNGSWQPLAQQTVTIDAFAGAAGDYLSSSGVAFMNGTTDFFRFWAGGTGNVLYTLGANIPVVEIWQMS